MNKNVLRNRAYLMSHSFNRTKMFHSKRGWMLSSALFLATLGTLMGAGAVNKLPQQTVAPINDVVTKATNLFGNITANATTTTNTINQRKQNIQPANSTNSSTSQASSSSVKSVASESSQSNNSTTNSNDTTLTLGTKSQQTRSWNFVQHGIDNNDYAPINQSGSSVVNNSASNNQTNPVSSASAKANVTSNSVSAKPSFNSAYKSYMAQMSGTDSKVASANAVNADSNSSKNEENKPLIKDTNTNPFSGTYTSGSINGLSYKLYKNNNALEFTDGTMEWNGGSMFQYNSVLSSNNIQHLKFDKLINMNNVTNMDGMFAGSNNIKDITFNTFSNNANNMNGMFTEDPNLQHINFPQNTINATAVTDMAGMFNFDKNLQDIDLSNFNTSINLRNLMYMFHSDKSIKTIKMPHDLNTYNVTNMSNMFNDDHNLQNLIIPTIDATNVTNTSWMFNSDYKLTKLPRILNTNSDTDISCMFSADKSLTSLTLPDSFNTNKVTNMNGTFANDSNLQSLSLPQSFNAPLVTNMAGMFAHDHALQSLDLSMMNTSSDLNTIGWMFDSDRALNKLILPKKLNTYKVFDMESAFASDSTLQDINLPKGFDTSNTHNMSSMFENDFTLQNLNLSQSFNTHNVRSTSTMFHNCNSLQHLTLPPKFNTKKITNMNDMFRNSGLEVLTIQSPNVSFSSDVELPTLYKETAPGLYAPNPNNFRNQNNVGTFANGSLVKPLTNPNHTEAGDNPSLVQSDLLQNYHYNNPMGHSNDIEAMVPNKDNSDKITSWDIYYLTDPFDKGAAGQWYKVNTSDFAKFNPTNSDAISVDNVAIPDPNYAINNQNKVEVSASDKASIIPWNQVAGGSIINNRKQDGSSWITKDTSGNAISPNARLAYIANFFGENDGSYLAYANPIYKDNHIIGYHQFKPESIQNVFNASIIGNGLSTDFRDPYVTTYNNGKDLVAYIAGGTNKKIYVLTSSDATDWKSKGSINVSDILDNTVGNNSSAEAPNIITLNGTPIMFFSAQDKSNEAKETIAYTTGTMNNGIFERTSNSKTGTVDQGFDDYAGNFEPLNNGKAIFIGWPNNWNSFFSEGSHIGGFTLPRVMSWNGTNMDAVPVEPGQPSISDAVNNTSNQYQTKGKLLIDFNKPTSNFNIDLTRSNDQNNYVSFNYQNGQLIIKRNGSNHNVPNMTSNSISLGKNQLSSIYFYLDNDTIEAYIPEIHKIYTILDLASVPNTPYTLSGVNKNDAKITSYQFNLSQAPALSTVNSDDQSTKQLYTDYQNEENADKSAINLNDNSKAKQIANEIDNDLRNANDYMSKANINGNQAKQYGNDARKHTSIALANDDNDLANVKLYQANLLLKQLDGQKSVTDTIAFYNQATNDLVGKIKDISGINGSTYKLSDKSSLIPSGYHLVDNNGQQVSSDTLTINPQSTISVKIANNQTKEVNHDIPVIPVTVKDTINYMYGKSKIGPSYTISGNDYQSGFHGTFNANSDTYLPQGYQLAPNQSATINYDGTTHNIQIVPVQKTDRINFVTPSDKSAGSTTTTGNDSRTGLNGNTTVPNNKVPAGYEIKPGTNATVPNDGQPHTIQVIPVNQTATVHYQLSDGQSVGTPTTISGDYGKTTTPTSIPDGYQATNNKPYTFNSNKRQSDIVTVRPNKVTGTATIHLHYVIKDNNGQTTTVSDGTKEIPINGQYGDSDTVITPAEYQPDNDDYNTNSKPLIINYNKLANKNADVSYNPTANFDYDAKQAPSLVIRYDNMANNAQVISSATKTFTPSDLEQHYGVKPQDWVDGNTMTFSTIGKNIPNSVAVIQAPAGFNLVENEHGYAFQNDAESIKLEPNSHDSQNHPIILMAMPLFHHKATSSASVIPKAANAQPSSIVNNNTYNSYYYNTNNSELASLSSEMDKNTSELNSLANAKSSSTSNTSTNPVISESTSGSNNTSSSDSDITMLSGSNKSTNTTQSASINTTNQSNNISNSLQTTSNIPVTNNNSIPTNSINTVLSHASAKSTNVPIIFGSSEPINNSVLAPSIQNNAINNMTSKLPQTNETNNYVGIVALITSILSLGLADIDFNNKHNK